ncbi:transcription factor [Teratosphaeriaceae sp. CCFEE 6253]|nr:transcription factor [Teratosphaeriaceae sp. CCFEE 6253]
MSTYGPTTMRMLANENEDVERTPSPELEFPSSWQHVRIKKAHKKSRNGCITCKRRRVKSPISIPLSPSLGPLQAGDSESQGLPSLARRVPDVVLWQHYLVRAAKTMVATSTDLAHARMWESSVPAVAFAEPAASHAMMAFSALCLDATSPTESALYDVQATAELHYCKAVEHLRTSLPVVDQAGADAVLACTMLLIPCGLALNRTPDAPRRDWLYHLRGFRALGANIYASSSMAAGSDQMIPYPQPGIPESQPYQANMGGGALWGPEICLFHEIRRSREPAMRTLRMAMENLDAGRDVAEECRAALESLEFVMDYTLECRVSNLFRAVFTWPVLITPAFADLLTTWNQAALAIFTHWLVLVMLLNDV